MPSRSHGERESGQHAGPPPATCPHCHQELPAEEGQAWLPIARLSNLAEAGFMANLLADEGVPSRIRQYDDFSALDGCWASIYVLQVTDQDARQAVDRIRRELDKSPPETPPQSSATVVADPTEETVVAWRTVAWVLVAGGLACLAGYSGLGGRERATPPGARPMLWEAVEGIGTPLTSKSLPGGPRFRLSFDAATEQFQLDEDRDGDGRYEQRRRFSKQALQSGR